MKIETVTIESQGQCDAVIIWLHGLGADGFDFVDVVPLLELPSTHGITFVFPHAPMQPVTLNGGMVMRAWYDIESIDINRKQDEIGLKNAEKLISEMIDHWVSKGISANRIILIGFSQGGAMALHTALRYPKSLGGCAALSSYLPIHELVEEQRDLANQNIPIFMAHGSFDPVVPYSMGKQSYTSLRVLNYLPNWHEYAMGHEVCLPEIKDLGNWIKSILQIEIKI